MNKEKSQNIKVISRFRPVISLEPNPSEADLNWFQITNSSTISVKKDSSPENFTFDQVFSMSSTQEEIFNFLGQPIVADVLAGYNGTVFAYGQTGSGKTYTMMGGDIFDPVLRGLVPRAISLIFSNLESLSKEQECTMKCSMLEIYKENLQDLLVRGPKLRMKENQSKGIYVEGLSEIYVVCEEEVLNALAVGEKNRSIASTKMNQQSSRSHQIFILEVSQKLSDGSIKKGCLNLVDLAGSEKISQTGATGEKLEEAKKINLSLSALGNVIKALTSGSEHIPYRDSKLTRLLQESLGGNFKTSLIVNCSPHIRNAEDSINTLKFAQRAKTMKNYAKVNVTLSIESYLKTIENLKKELASALSDVNRLQDIKENPSILPNNPDQNFEKERVKNEELSEEICKIKEKIEETSKENLELKTQVSESDLKLTSEKFKRVQSEEQISDLIQKIKYLELQLDEKLGNEIRLMSENKKLETQIAYLTKILEEFSVKFSEQLEKISSDQKLTTNDYFFKTIAEVSKALLDPPIKYKRYFPESIKLEDFLSKISSFSESYELDLRKRAMTAEIINCELSKNHWTLYTKHLVLKEKYSHLFSSFDLQKKTLNSFKNQIESMQLTYADMFAKVYKTASNILSVSSSKIRRPVNNAIPEIFNSSQPPNKELLRRSSILHMVTNGFDSGLLQNPKEENLSLKNIETKLESQILFNKQLKIKSKSLKQKNNQMASLIDSLNLSQSKFEKSLSDKVDFVVKVLENLIHNFNAKAKPWARSSSVAQVESFEINEADVQRKKDKTLTVPPGNFMKNLKSSISQNFLKFTSSPIIKKIGDTSPLFRNN